MPDASSLPIDHYPDFLARLPVGLELEALAREHKAFRRARGVRSGTDLFRLSLAWGPSGYSLQQVAAWAGEQGIADITDEALIQRLQGALPFLQAVTNEILAVPPPQAPCWHGRVLRISDSTSLSKQASKGTDWRLHGVYYLGIGGFSHLELTDSHGGEALDRGKPGAGEIRIADRGYANALSWQRFCEVSQGQADYIVRMRWNTVRLINDKDDIFDLTKWLQSLPTELEIHEIAVRVQSGKHQAPVPIRLVVRRKTTEAIEATHKHLRRNAIRKQTKLDDRSLIAAEFLILATSLPAGEFPAIDILAVYRLRRQVELAFKRLKSLLHIDKLRTKTETGSRCWLYAHLIVALLCDDLSQDFLESFPSGVV